MSRPSRRSFLGHATAAAGVLATSPWTWGAPASSTAAGRPVFGLVTYMWGAQWDLPTLLSNCAKAGAPGVELRTTHAHGVERTMSETQRSEARKCIADSGVTMVGIGSNENFDSPDPAKLKQSIEATKDFIRLSHDVGGSGVKVKPNDFHKQVPREKTIEQIGRALNEVGEYGAGFGQQIRLEVHGQCAELPTIKSILDVATHPNVAICWNSNPQDLQGAGLEQNFKLVANRFGDTCHIHELDDPKYPYPQLIKLLVQSNYNGWVLLEASSRQDDLVAALARQAKLFEELVAKSRS